MLEILAALAWIFCILYSTIPAFWLLIHPHADFWRSRPYSPYKILLPLWIAMWIALSAITAPWRAVQLYRTNLTWIPAALLFSAGFLLYKLSHHKFTLAQLGGLPEILPGREHEPLATTGIRAHIRHPVYLAHLCEMLAWSLGSGLAVCWALTALAIVTGAAMIRMEDEELAKRFGREYLEYRNHVPAILPKLAP
jgi:protein-S-isoprenylcysteine O-methyltransferase Ste14